MSLVAAAASVAAGVWLMAAPDVLGYADPVRSVHHAVEPLAASVAAIALWKVTRAVLRADLLLALALLVAVAFGGGVDAIVNGLVCALVLGSLSLVPIRGDDPFAGGWIGLLRAG
jgi:hypothetical protein